MRRMFSKNQLENQTEELLASGNLPSVKADEIIENMSGYEGDFPTSSANWTRECIYMGVVKNGNKITFVCAFNITAEQDAPSNEFALGSYTVPTEVYNSLYPSSVGGASLLAKANIGLTPANDYHLSKDAICYFQKYTDNKLSFALALDASSILEGSTYFGRVEFTFLLSDSLID